MGTKFGDTPRCMDKGLDLDRRNAYLQGFGLTEEGVIPNKLFELNVTLLEATSCQRRFDSLFESEDSDKEDFCKNLKNGVEEQHLCGLGSEFRNEDFGNSCKGDSGGGVLVREDGKEVLVGVISGNLDCYSGSPDWYAKVAYHREWIDCIMSDSAEYNFSKVKLEKACKEKAIVMPDRGCSDTCSFIVDECDLFG